MPCTWPLRAVPLTRAASAAGSGAPAGGPGAPGGDGRPEAPAHLTALGLAPADLEGPGGEPGEEEVAAAALVRLHFYAGDPGPLAFPRVALRLLELLLEEEVDVAELCRLVELDAALAGAVLARANAASARSLDPILAVPHAVTRLGISEVARVAAAAALRALYAERARTAPGAFEPLWPLLFRHAVTTGRLAAELARGRAGRGPGPELAFTAGLLHDVGLAVALRSLAALTQDGTLALRAPDSALRVVLRVHGELGEEAARGWALPAPLAEVVARHHAAAPGAEPPLVRVVALASALDLLGAAPALAAVAAREAVAAALALGGSPAWLAAAVARREEAAAWTRRAFAAL